MALSLVLLKYTLSKGSILKCDKALIANISLSHLCLVPQIEQAIYCKYIVQYICNTYYKYIGQYICNTQYDLLQSIVYSLWTSTHKNWQYIANILDNIFAIHIANIFCNTFAIHIALVAIHMNVLFKNDATHTCIQYICNILSVSYLTNLLENIICNTWYCVLQIY